MVPATAFQPYVAGMWSLPLCQVPARVEDGMVDQKLKRFKITRMCPFITPRKNIKKILAALPLIVPVNSMSEPCDPSRTCKRRRYLVPGAVAGDIRKRFGQGRVREVRVHGAYVCTHMGHLCD